MSRYKSRKPPQRLLDEIELCRKWVRHFDANGQHDTTWHTTLERLEKALTKYKKPSIEKDEGEIDGTQDL